MIIIPKNKIYNSYIIESLDVDKACGVVKDFIVDFGFDKALIEEKSHPDLIEIERDEKKQSISIDMIREKLIDKVSTIPTIAKRKIFIVKVDTFLSQEIQNTLLKTLEEPPTYVSIFIVIKNRDALLDTVKSRCVYVRDDEYKSIIDDIKDRDYIENILKVVIDLKYNDMYDIIDLSKVLSNIKSNDEYKKMLLYMLYLSRDAFYYKKTFDKKGIVLKEREVQIISMAEAYTYEVLGKLMDMIERSLSYVDSNVDKQLMIENILMNSKKLFN